MEDVGGKAVPVDISATKLMKLRLVLGYISVVTVSHYQQKFLWKVEKQ